ncbi:MAG TPA: hypothetical protein VJ870_12935 [Amycolatopsis sp.]|nr:hypothetical protein [Amycolatopsis sp.]
MKVEPPDLFEGKFPVEVLTCSRKWSTKDDGSDFLDRRDRTYDTHRL